VSERARLPLAIAVCAAALLLSSSPVRAETPSQKAIFALILGVNRGPDAALPTLRYADDDAAQYLDLFRALGARTYLLARLDDNSSRIHPQANAEAHDPRRRELDRALAGLAADVAQARERGIETVFYFVYSGHGNVRDGEGYLSLEDGRLDAKAIEQEIVDRVHAGETHLIVDACYSYFLAYGRGAGGQRRQVSGFSRLSGLASRGQVGLLLSTSSARESHEWEAFQSGVFSHEVRSGLYGAADVDGDGQVSYREIAAFVDRANAAIPNERFRPDVYARPPGGTAQLLDLRAGQARRIELDATRQGHYVLEDTRGVRVAEFHNSQPIQLVRPIGSGPLYLRHADDQAELVIPPSDGVVAVAGLTPRAGPVRARGAAHDAFSTIFSLPFNLAAGERYAFRALPEPILETPQERRARHRRLVGYGVMGLGGAALVTGLTLSLTARSLREVDPATSQEERASRNDRIRAQNAGAVAMYAVTGAAALASILLVLLPERREGAVTALASPTELGLGYRVSF